MFPLRKSVQAVISRISTYFYAAVAVAGLSTAVVVLIAWQSFDRIADSQQQVFVKSLPEMVSVIAISRASSDLAAATPRLAAAQSREEVNEIAETIAALRTRLERELHMLTSMEEAEGTEQISADARRLTEIVSELEDTMLRSFELRSRTEKNHDGLIALESQLSRELVPMIDDQYFYLVTGRTEIGKPLAARESHFTASELNFYRHLADIKLFTNAALQLLFNAGTVTDPALLKVRLEQFESMNDGLQRSLDAIDRPGTYAILNPLLDRLLELGSGNENRFLLRELELQLLASQQALIADSRVLSSQLVLNAERLAAAVNTRALESAEQTAQMIATSRTLQIVLGSVGVAGAVIVAWLLVGQLLMPRLHYLSQRMREMGLGELDDEIEVKGSDEIAEMATALEIFRKSALDARRLDVAEKLSRDLQAKNNELQSVLDQLQSAQSQIVMREKLAALGELTAGVAHEIKNPLNFVNNFSEASKELIEELEEILEDSEMDEEERKEEIESICEMLVGNVNRILEHGNRAVRIVTDMLRMGRGGGHAQETDINQLVEQHTKLAYHGARASTDDFQIHLGFDLDPETGSPEIISQDIGRVILNLVGNSCYATHQKRLQAIERAGAGSQSDYSPELRVSTQLDGDFVGILIRDNGNGMPAEIREKIFNPFFTTKPTDQGTGLGLAICNDIVLKHGGTIEVDSEEGKYTEMRVTLRRDAGEILALFEAKEAAA